jgi:hypothetical protein
MPSRELNTVLFKLLLRIVSKSMNVSNSFTVLMKKKEEKENAYNPLKPSGNYNICIACFKN